MSTKQSDKPATEKKRRAKSRAQETTTVNKRTAKTEANEKQSRKEKKESKQTEKKARVRIFPVWMRIIIVLILAVAALVAGLMIGYGIIGEGTPADALKVETWQHIIDIVTKTE